MAIDNDTRNELSRESTRLREKLHNELGEEFENFVMDNIAIPPEEDDSLVFLDECVGFLLEEFVRQNLGYLWKGK